MLCLLCSRIMTSESRFIGNAGQDNTLKSAVNVLCLAKHELHVTLKELISQGQVNHKLLKSANFFLTPSNLPILANSLNHALNKKVFCHAD